jgi:hypothetical protein
LPMPLQPSPVMQVASGVFPSIFPSNPLAIPSQQMMLDHGLVGLFGQSGVPSHEVHILSSPLIMLQFCQFLFHSCAAFCLRMCISWWKMRWKKRNVPEMSLELSLPSKLGFSALLALQKAVCWRRAFAR